MKVFLDTNVLLDMLISSRANHLCSLRLLKLIRDKKISGVLTSQSIIDAAYVQTQRGKVTVQDFKTAMKLICSLVEVVSITSEDIDRVNASSIEDYEDAAQVSCALDCGCDVIVTRDSRIGRFTDLDLYSPQGVIEKMKASGNERRF